MFQRDLSTVCFIVTLESKNFIKIIFLIGRNRRRDYQSFILKITISRFVRQHPDWRAVTPCPLHKSSSSREDLVPCRATSGMWTQIRLSSSREVASSAIYSGRKIGYIRRARDTQYLGDLLLPLHKVDRSWSTLL